MTLIYKIILYNKIRQFSLYVKYFYLFNDYLIKFIFNKNNCKKCFKNILIIYKE